jgi:hypothetical protein
LYVIEKVIIYTRVCTVLPGDLMTAAKRGILLTIKMDEALDASIQKAIDLLGYKSKAELAREAIRDFLIRHRLYSLLGGEPSVPCSSNMTPDEALTQLRAQLGKVPKKIINEEVDAARDEVAKALLGDE